jgi:hypothetical protein
MLRVVWTLPKAAVPTPKSVNPPQPKVKQRGPLAPEDGRAGVDMVGIAQALAYAPDLPNRWKQAEAVIEVPRVTWKSSLASSTTMALTKLQLQRMGRGQRPTFGVWAPWVLLRDQLRTLRLNKSYRLWLEART